MRGNFKYIGLNPEFYKREKKYKKRAYKVRYVI